MTSITTSRNPTQIERCIASGAGRAARVSFGASLVVFGLAIAPKPLGHAVALFGLLPVATGAFNLCPIAPFWGGSFFGADYCRPRQSSGEGTGMAAAESKSVNRRGNEP